MKKVKSIISVILLILGAILMSSCEALVDEETKDDAVATEDSRNGTFLLSAQMPFGGTVDVKRSSIFYVRPSRVAMVYNDGDYKDVTYTYQKSVDDGDWVDIQKTSSIESYLEFSELSKFDGLVKFRILVKDDSGVILHTSNAITADFKDMSDQEYDLAEVGEDDDNLSSNWGSSQTSSRAELSFSIVKASYMDEIYKLDLTQESKLDLKIVANSGVTVHIKRNGDEIADGVTIDNLSAKRSTNLGFSLSSDGTPDYKINTISETLAPGSYTVELSSNEGAALYALADVEVASTGNTADVTGTIANLISRQTFNELFPNGNHYANHLSFIHITQKALFGYDNLVKAAKLFPDFCNSGNDAKDKRELAAFLANTSHETTGGGGAYTKGSPRYTWGYCFPSEVGMNDNSLAYRFPGHALYPASTGKSYHGRGPVQLSWNYNYGYFSEQFYGNISTLLDNPEKILEDGELFFATAIWFWMTPSKQTQWQSAYPKPSCHATMLGKSTGTNTWEYLETGTISINGTTIANGAKRVSESGTWVPDSKQKDMYGVLPGFGSTINIINGGLESGTGNAHHHGPDDRVGFYLTYCAKLGIEPIDTDWGYADNSYNFDSWDTSNKTHKQLASRYQTAFNSQSMDYNSTATGGVITIDSDVADVISIVDNNKQESNAVQEAVIGTSADTYIAWADNAKYALANKVVHLGKLWECINPHTANAWWSPDQAQSLWKLLGDVSTEVAIVEAVVDGDGVVTQGAATTKDKTKITEEADNSNAVITSTGSADINFSVAKWRLGKWSIKDNKAIVEWNIYWGTKADNWQIVNQAGTVLFTSDALDKSANAQKGMKTIDVSGVTGIEVILFVGTNSKSSGLINVESSTTASASVVENIDDIEVGDEVDGVIVTNENIENTKTEVKKEEAKTSVAGKYDSWNYPVAYMVGSKVLYEEKIYECIIPHNSNSAWIPNSGGASLWRDLGDAIATTDADGVIETDGAVNINIPNIEYIVVDDGEGSLIKVRKAKNNIVYTGTEKNGKSITLDNTDANYLLVSVPGVTDVVTDYSIEITAKYDGAKKSAEIDITVDRVPEATVAALDDIIISGVEEGKVYTSNISITVSGGNSNVITLNEISKTSPIAVAIPGSNEQDYSLKVFASKDGAQKTKTVNFTMQKVTPAAEVTLSGKKVVGYYINWAQYRSGRGQFMVKDIDFSLYTHLLYGFADTWYEKSGIDYDNDGDAGNDYNFCITAFEWNDINSWTIDDEGYDAGRYIPDWSAIKSVSYCLCGWMDIQRSRYWCTCDSQR